MPLSEIAKRCRVLVSDVVADEARQSLPVPVREGGEVFFDFLFFPSSLSEKGVQMAPPQFWARMTRAGELHFLKRVNAADFGGQDQDFAILGTFALPPDWDVQVHLKHLQALNELLDQLSVPFQEKQTGPEWFEKCQQAKREYQLLIEPPVDFYYRQIGRDFFAWLEEIRK